ncbi:MAG: 50S ribosomal protein L6 [Nanoarchaeota archaeon]|nr:50S ribosomal protein L6 [Nanoarchaeota archaeon]
MTDNSYKETIPLPEGVSASFDESIVTVKGAKGEVSRSFLHPKIDVKVTADAVEFSVKRYSKAEKKMLNTFIAHLSNMFKGSMEGHEYKLKICSGHFPMNVSLKGNELEVKNFIGEAVPRKIAFKEGVEVKMDGDIITVKGLDKELTGQTAASIEKLTRRNGFDRRIFQDGIYIIEKDGKTV